MVQDPSPRASARPKAASAAILVVDDEPGNILLLSEVLRDLAEVCFATSGQGALSMASERAFDLVLLDVGLPDLDGFEVCRRLKEAGQDMPVIFVTAMGELEKEARGFEVGGADYITKPFSPPIVRARARAHLELKEQRDFLRRTFGRYLSDAVVTTLLQSPEGLRLGGEKRCISLLMCDLRGFTALSERLPPESVVRMLNNYLGTMVDVILEHGGTVDEFQGDSVLALFGAPIARDDDARRAIECALSMQIAMAQVNSLNVAEGLPELEMGVAVHTGEVVVGNVGSVRRAKYGVVGGNVNLTSRIESFTVGGQVLISGAALAMAGEGVVVGEAISVRAKGLSEPVVAHDLLGVRGARDLDAPRHDESMAEVVPPMPVHLDVLEGKRAHDEGLPGSLVALSHRGAVLHVAQALEPLANVRLLLDDPRGPAASPELYAKVLGGEGERCRLRFTHVPDEARARIVRELDRRRIAAGARRE